MNFFKTVYVIALQAIIDKLADKQLILAHD